MRLTRSGIWIEIQHGFKNWRLMLEQLVVVFLTKGTQNLTLHFYSPSFRLFNASKTCITSTFDKNEKRIFSPWLQWCYNRHRMTSSKLATPWSKIRLVCLRHFMQWSRLSVESKFKRSKVEYCSAMAASPVLGVS
jgi:hypothetical protein